MRITILGAGDMGTAIATPAIRNGHDVRLWGTSFDQHIIDLLRSGAAHPRLSQHVPASVGLFASDELGTALADADIVILAVSSHAVDHILDLCTPLINPDMILVSMAKGLVQAPDGIISLICHRIIARTRCPVVSVGGPSKANEVGLDLPTAVVFAGEPADALEQAATALRTSMYAIQTTDDLIGVEIGAALKNAYAIAVGVATGMEEQSGLPYQNLKAALINEAVLELAEVAASLGGRRETIQGLAGVGDLTVTVAAGRNRLLGELLGRGIPVTEALSSLSATGMTIEGYAAVELGYHLVRQTGANPEQFPLLNALYQVLYQDAPVFDTLWHAVTT